MNKKIAWLVILVIAIAGYAVITVSDFAKAAEFNTAVVWTNTYRLQHGYYPPKADFDTAFGGHTPEYYGYTVNGNDPKRPTSFSFTFIPNNFRLPVPTIAPMAQEFSFAEGSMVPIPNKAYLHFEIGSDEYCYYGTEYLFSSLTPLEKRYPSVKSICDEERNFEIQSESRISEAVSKQDPSLCDSLSNDYKEGCYSKVANAGTNIVACNKLSPGTTQDECLLNVTVKIGDVSKCPDLVNIHVGTEYEEKCVQQLAVSQKNISTCNAISTSRPSCYVAVIRAEDDVQKCAELDQLTTGTMGMYGPTAKNECYYEFADAKLDTNLCSLIDNQADKAKCIDIINGTSR